MVRKKSTTRIEDQSPEEREKQQRLNLSRLAMIKSRYPQYFDELTQKRLDIKKAKNELTDFKRGREKD